MCHFIKADSEMVQIKVSLIPPWTTWLTSYDDTEVKIRR